MTSLPVSEETVVTSRSPGPMRTITVGHSHLQALRAASRNPHSAACTSKGFEFDWLFIDGGSEWTSPLVVERNGAKKLNPALGLELQRLGAFDRSRRRGLISALSGNIHNAFGLLRHDEPYDLIVPGEPALVPDRTARIVPVEQVLSYFRDKAQPFFEFFARAMQEVEPDYAAWVEPPPPLPSTEHILANLDVWFRKNRDSADLEVNPVELRYKLWLLNRRVLEEGAEAGGWRLIRTPLSVQDANGYLTESAWSRDATHGNAWYGERVLEAIVADASSSAGKE